MTAGRMTDVVPHTQQVVSQNQRCFDAPRQRRQMPLKIIDTLIKVILFSNFKLFSQLKATKKAQIDRSGLFWWCGYVCCREEYKGSGRGLCIRRSLALYVV